MAGYYPLPLTECQCGVHRNNCSDCGATIGDGKTLCNSCANKRVGKQGSVYVEAEE